MTLVSLSSSSKITGQLPGLEAPDQFGVWDHPLSSHGLPLAWNVPSPCPTIHLLLLQGLLLDKGSTKALEGPLLGPLRNACLEVAQATSFVSGGQSSLRLEA